MIRENLKLFLGLFIFLQLFLFLGDINSFMTSITISVCTLLLANMLKIRVSPIRLSLNFFRFSAYIFWLVKEIAVSSFGVIRIIIMNKQVKPSIDQYSTSDDPILKLAYLNSITLTPGTISINSSKKSINVHSITAAHKEDLKSGVMYSKIKRVFK